MDVRGDMGRGAGLVVAATGEADDEKEGEKAHAAVLLSHWRDFVRKKSVVVECGFYRGFSRKVGAERGVFVVRV